MSDEKYMTVIGTIATTHAIPGRPVRLAREALEHARDQLLAGGGAIAQQIEHDSRRRIEPTVTGAEVRQGDDGEFSLVVTMRMSESDYQRLEGRIAFSVAFPEMGVPGWPSPQQPLLTVMVDSYHWDDAAILAALNSFSDATFPVEGARYHQFAGEPPAKIVFDLLLNYKDIPPALLAAYLVESAKVLLGRRKKQTEEWSETKVDELAPVEQADNKSMPPTELVAEQPATPAALLVSSPESAGKSEDSALTKVTLEFRSDSRRAAIDCDGSESSHLLLEAIIRALAEVTPLAGEQDNRPGDVQ